MATITVQVEDEALDEFLEELKKFEKEENLNEGDIKIFGLNIEEYQKVIKETKEVSF